MHYLDAKSEVKITTIIKREMIASQHVTILREEIWMGITLLWSLQEGNHVELVELKNIQDTTLFQ